MKSIRATAAVAVAVTTISEAGYAKKIAYTERIETTTFTAYNDTVNLITLI